MKGKLRFNVLDHIPPFEPDKKCERCGAAGSRYYSYEHFTGERLCPQCTHNDVFEVMSDRTD
jgi:hypothetical protein